MTGGIRIRGVILAAGRGERARPLTEVLPKALVNIAGRTLLDRIIDALVQAGIHDVTVATGFKAPMIENHLQARMHQHLADPSIDIVTVDNYEIGPLRTALTAIESKTDTDFLICPVDAVVSPYLISEMLGHHNVASGSMLLAVDFAVQSGTIVSTDSEQRITGIGDLVLTDRYSLGRSAMLLITNRNIIDYSRTALSKGESRIVPVLNTMIHDGILIYSHNVKSAWFDVDTIADILRVNEYFLMSEDMHATDNSIFIPHGDSMEIGDRLRMRKSDIVIGKGTSLRGPVLISPGTNIDEQCRIGPTATIGPNARIAKNCEIRDAVIHANSEIRMNTQVQDSVIYGTQTFPAEM